MYSSFLNNYSISIFFCIFLIKKYFFKAFISKGSERVSALAREILIMGWLTGSAPDFLKPVKKKIFLKGACHARIFNRSVRRGSPS